MEQRHRLVLLLSMLICFLHTPSSLLAQDYCSLRVRVLAPNGKPFPVYVTVYEKSGRVIEKEQAPPDDVQFCDLGILPVKVVIGPKGCHEITVDDVRNYWREPYTLAVTYDPEHCMRELLPPPQPICEVLLRISGLTGEWVDKATVTFQKPSLQPLRTDSAGRALLIAGLSKNIKALATAPGYVSKAFSVACTKPGEYENLVRLSKK